MEQPKRMLRRSFFFFFFMTTSRLSLLCFSMFMLFRFCLARDSVVLSPFTTCERSESECERMSGERANERRAGE